jgi:hypothetical protein
MPDRRQFTSPQNGRQSRGPVTQAGKDRCRFNSVRHGLLAADTVLAAENPAGFQNYVDALLDRFQPADDFELQLLADLASASWRKLRTRALETRMLDQASGKVVLPADADGLDALVAAFDRALANPTFSNLSRYERQFESHFDRAFRRLLAYHRSPFAQQSPTEEEDPAPQAVHAAAA